MYCKRCGREFQGKKCPSCGQIHEDHSPGGAEDVSSMFLEADESLVSQMSRGYLSNLVLGGNLSSDFVVLSDRRVYYSGSFVGRVGQAVGKLTGQIILPLHKVTSISFLEKKNLGLLIAAWVMLIGGLTIGFMAFETSDGASFLALIPSVVFFITYFFSVNRFFVISTYSASIQISYRLYGEDAIRKFAHELGKTLTRFHAAEVSR